VEAFGMLMGWGDVRYCFAMAILVIIIVTNYKYFDEIKKNYPLKILYKATLVKFGWPILKIYITTQQFGLLLGSNNMCLMM
jgi:hypothetical protein